MTIPHPGFLADIVENPDDDTPRLIAADWLDDNGDPQRAEFIRLQLGAGRPDTPPDEIDEANARASELLASHLDEWRGPFDAATKPHFARGFVEGVDLDPDAFAARGPELTACAPVRVVNLGSAERDLDLWRRFGSSAALRRLRDLRFYDCQMEDVASAEAVFGAGNLAGLRHLTLGEGDTNPETMRVLASSGLAGLRELYLWDFHEGELGADGAAFLASDPAFANLEALDLLNTGVGEAGARAIAESATLRNLKHLSFGRQACGYGPNYIGAAGVRALANSPHLAGLTALGLAINRLDASAMEALAASPYLRSLKYLWLPLNDTGDSGLSSLAASPVLDSVESLDVGSNGVTDAGVKALAKSPHARNLRTLSLHGNEAGDAGVKALANSPHLRSLRVLCVNGRGLSGASAKLLASEAFPALREVWMYGYPKDGPGAEALRARFGARVRM